MSYDNFLIESCENSKIELENLGGVDFYIEKIESKYPFKYNRIDFGLLKNHKFKKITDENLSFEYKKFFYSVSKFIEDYTEFIYLGDSLTENAYSFKKEFFESFIEKITEIPQSHYIFSKDLSWCINFSFENELNFGSIPCT